MRIENAHPVLHRIILCFQFFLKAEVANCTAALSAQRFPDVISWETLALDEQRRYSLLEQIECGRGARRASANNDHLTFLHKLLVVHLLATNPTGAEAPDSPGSGNR